MRRAVGQDAFSRWVRGLPIAPLAHILPLRFASLWTANYAQGMLPILLFRRAIMLLVAGGSITLGTSVAQAQFDNKDAGTAGGQLGQAQTHKWEFGVVITGAGGPSVNVHGTAPIPGDWPEQQAKVIGEEVTPNVRRHSYRTIDGLKQLLFEVPKLAVGEKATCLITLEVTRSEQLAPTDTGSLVIPKEIPKEVRKFLGPSPLIESGNSKIKSQAKTLTLDKEGAWQTVEAIYDGTRALVEFDVDNKDKFKGAIGALRDGKADKEDLNATFVALCRASKIPARMAWSMDSCYAEFYLADSAGKGMWFPCQLHGDRVFGGIKDFRAILEKGDNFRVPEKAEAQRFVAEFLTGKGSGARPQVEFRRRRLD